MEFIDKLDLFCGRNERNGICISLKFNEIKTCDYFLGKKITIKYKYDGNVLEKELLTPYYDSGLYKKISSLMHLDDGNICAELINGRFIKSSVKI